MSKTDELVAKLAQLKRDEAQFQARIEDLDASLDRAIEVLEVPEELAADLSQVDRLLRTTRSVLQLASICPAPVGPFVRTTKTGVEATQRVVGPAKDTAVAFDRVVDPIREGMKRGDQAVHRAAVGLGKFQQGVAEFHAKVKRVNDCMVRQRLDRTALDAFSAEVLPTVARLDSLFVETNRAIKQLDDAVDAAEDTLKGLIPVGEALDKLSDVLGELNVALDPIEAALRHKISVTYGVKVKIKGKWYEPWKWRVKTNWKKFRFSVKDILDGVDAGIGEVTKLLQRGAEDFLRPIMGKVDLTIKLPPIPGLDKLQAQFARVSRHLTEFASGISELEQKFNALSVKLGELKGLADKFDFECEGC